MASTTNEQNIVVSRRLAIVEKLTKAQVKAYVDGNTSVEEIAETLNESATRALFGVRQAAVNYGFVKPLTLDADNQDAVKAAHGNGNHSDWAWLACRAGVTPQRLQSAMRGGEKVQPQSTAASTRGKQGKGATKSRRTRKA
jgi:hypothetical protein